MSLAVATAFAESVITNPTFDLVAVTGGAVTPDPVPATTPTANYAYQVYSGSAFDGLNSLYTSYVYPNPTTLPEQDFNASAGIGWNFGVGTGLVQNGSAFGNPTIPTPADANTPQAAFIQVEGALSQTVNLVVSPYYSLSFLLAARPGQNQILDITITGPGNSFSTSVSSAGLNSFTLETFAIGPVTTAGSYTLTFTGTASTDNTAFIDDVGLATPEPGTIGLFLMAGALLCLVRRKVRFL